MVFECYNWLLHLYKQIIGDHGDDDNKWLWLTSSSSSSSRDKTLILRYFCSSGYLRISVIDGKSKKEYKTRGGLKSIEKVYFVGCCNGLVLFHSYEPSRVTIVVDPLSKEMETISGPFKGGQPCALFFHPLAKEYRILNVRCIKDGEYEYHIYLFGAKVWRKIANPHRPTYVGCNPTIVNDALHWYKGGTTVLVFDIITEEFSFRTLPFEVKRLYVKDDKLCVCLVSLEEPIMDIWVLEDYEKWRWARKYAVNLDWDMKMYPVETTFDSLSSIMGDIRVISIKNNELVLLWEHRGMFSYHLKFHTVEKLPWKKSEMEMDFLRYGWSRGIEAYNQ